VSIGAVNESGRTRRLRLGMVGGGEGAFIGAVHRIAARIDDEWELVAGAFSSDPARGRRSGIDLRLDPQRCYGSFKEMAAAEATRSDRIDAVAIVTPNHVHHPAASAFLAAGIDVICDKPLCRTMREARDLVAQVSASGRLFAITYNYTGYPMVRQAREMVAAGELGTIRTIQAEYAQDWLSTDLETTGQKQADWRTDPTRSGAGGAIGDIGTHAFNLAEFIAGQECAELAADLSTFVAGRRLDDNAQMLLRFAGGARGALWASQVAPGNENGLAIRIHGEKAALSWRQEHPNQLVFSRLGQPPVALSRGGPTIGAAAAHATRLPSGHPEGYLEGFAQLYRDVAAQLRARQAEIAVDPLTTLVPSIREGVRGMAFVTAAIASSAADGAWTAIQAY
jgi:predicted dehydrogenase